MVGKMSVKTLREVAEIMAEFGLTEVKLGDIHATMEPKPPQLTESEREELEKLNAPVSDEDILLDPYVGLQDPTPETEGDSADE
jgi:hypothetical protein